MNPDTCTDDPMMTNHLAYCAVCSAYIENHAAAPPLALKDAKCEIAAEYTKKKNVIRLTLSDQSEYLFMTHDPVEMNQWQTKIQFHAGMIFYLVYLPVFVVIVAVTISQGCTGILFQQKLAIFTSLVPISFPLNSCWIPTGIYHRLLYQILQHFVLNSPINVHCARK